MVDLYVGVGEFKGGHSSSSVYHSRVESVVIDKMRHLQLLFQQDTYITKINNTQPKVPLLSNPQLELTDELPGDCS